ncbi:YjiH family protein [Priestia abyssalis]|uniref:YjiH family protein n=1 Tax=Priestia abyssalis TaxID=1221450 RepID=UPI0009957B52|nr:YjiH family protein [Priestia abyssalis]
MKAEIKIQEQSRSKNYMKFFLPSLIGVLLFLIPVTYKGEVTIGVGVMATYLQNLFADYLPALIVIIMGLSAIFSIFAKVFKMKVINENPFLNGLFNVGIGLVLIRMMGFLFGAFTLWEIGPEFVWSKGTGGVVLFDLAPVLIAWFLFAGMLLPLLVEFGLMEFIGALVQRIMRPLFTLPGRSSIDCLASWMGAGTVGVLVTTKQYDEGYYTKREAAVIATNFSIASIAFSLIVISFLDLSHMFVPFYLTVVVSGIVAAIIVPRIPPLSLKKDTYYEPVGQQIDETIPKGASKWKWGLDQAVQKANSAADAKTLVKSGVETVLDIWFGLLPLVMSLGTIVLIVAEYTTFFQIISYPLIPILNLLQIPEAQQAAQALMIGFADMFLPAVIGSGIESELTRFVIATVSLTQLIYMSEIGILILRSNIPLTFLELFIIFLQRTLVTLPIVALIAHMLF